MTRLTTQLDIAYFASVAKRQHPLTRLDESYKLTKSKDNGGTSLLCCSGSLEQIEINAGHSGGLR